MMILGIGVDLCRIERIRRSIDRFGKAWLDEVFTEDEQKRLGLGEQLAHQAALGFALKEACSKTIGTGFANGVRRQDFIVRMDAKECFIRLTGVAKRRAVKLCGSSAFVQLHTQVLSTTNWVSALVVLESGHHRSSLDRQDLLPALPD